MNLISIIVPVYKTEKYIDRCIESILAQTFTNFELILVDDGSPDNSGKICDSWAKKDNRIRVIHKENGGVSDARNAGVDAAVGEYITFCDSDDYVDNNWCLTLYNETKKHNAFLVGCNWVIVSGSKYSYPFEWSDNNKLLCSGYLEFFKTNTSGSVWNKLYKSEIINKFDIRFPCGCPIAEDAQFNADYCKHIKGYIFISKPLYYYNCQGESAMHKYYTDWFGMHLQAFYCRIPLIDEKDLPEYCDIWLNLLIPLIENIYDKRNKMAWYKKYKYNKSKISSTEFQYCLSHAKGNVESRDNINLLKKKKYLIYRIKCKIARLKNKLKGWLI